MVKTIEQYLEENPNLPEALKNYYENQEGVNTTKKGNGKVARAVSVAIILLSLLACEQPDGSKPDTETNIPVVPDPDKPVPDPDKPELTDDVKINGTAIGEDGTISIEYNGSPFSIEKVGTGNITRNFIINLGLNASQIGVPVEFIGATYTELKAKTSGTVTINYADNYTASSSTVLQNLPAGTVAPGVNVAKNERTLPLGEKRTRTEVTLSGGKTLHFTGTDIPINDLYLNKGDGSITSPDWDNVTASDTTSLEKMVWTSDIIEFVEGVTGTADNPVTPKLDFKVRSDVIDRNQGEDITALYELIKAYPKSAPISHFSALQLSGRFYIDGSNAGSPNSETSFEDLERASRILNDVRNYTVTDLPTSNPVFEDGVTATRINYSFTNPTFLKNLSAYINEGPTSGRIEFKDKAFRLTNVQVDSLVVLKDVPETITLAGRNFSIDATGIPQSSWAEFPNRVVISVDINKLYAINETQKTALNKNYNSGYSISSVQVGGTIDHQGYINAGNAANAPVSRTAYENARNEIMPNGRQGFAKTNTSSRYANSQGTVVRYTPKEIAKAQPTKVQTPQEVTRVGSILFVSEGENSRYTDLTNLLKNRGSRET